MDKLPPFYPHFRVSDGNILHGFWLCGTVPKAFNNCQYAIRSMADAHDKCQ